MPARRKVAVIGWDCATPQLIFGPHLDAMPNLKRLIGEGVYGRMRSSDPPITVPAWTSMMTGVDAGALGLYGFRNRKDYTYDGLEFATSHSVKRDRVWERLGREALRSIVVGVPQTYPPKPFNGDLVTSFLTPSIESPYTHPAGLKDEIVRVLGEPYMLDVEGFRTDDKQSIIDQCTRMTEQRTRLAEHLLAHHPWDFFMMVEMGPDRLYHGLWSFTDPEHPKYEAGNPFENAIRDYHAYLDACLGRLLAAVGEETVVFVVSDHGAKKMDGGICVNEWLMANGWLALAGPPPVEPTPFSKCRVDWSRTRAWGEGGYYARVFLNVRGREPHGLIPEAAYDTVRDELAEALAAIPDNRGNPIGTRVLKPEEVYPIRNGIPPDLIVYWGDLGWRSVGSVGMGAIHTFENDIGPDDANHDYDGIFVMRDPDRPGGGRELEALHLRDVAPTILGLYGLEPEPDVQGRRIIF